MRALIIGPAQHEAIRAVKTLAAQQAVPYEQVRAMTDKRAQGMVRNPLNDDLTITIPQGYRVTYTHEHQRPADICECRHISISVEDAKPGFGPHPTAFAEIMRVYGFKNDLPTLISHGLIWDTRDGGDMILEAVEPLDGDISKLARKP